MCDTCLEHEVKMAGKRNVSFVWETVIVRDPSPQGQRYPPGDQSNLKGEGPCMISPDSPCELSDFHFFRLCCVLISLALKWLVCQTVKHLQLERIRLIKEMLSSKRWEVCHLLRNDSSENGCLEFPGSVYDSCQAMLRLSNHPAGDHIIELILSINIDNNKED